MSKKVSNEVTPVEKEMHKFMYNSLAEHAYEDYCRAYDNWNKCALFSQIKYGTDFYSAVKQAGNINTYLYSPGAMEILRKNLDREKGVNKTLTTPDHFISPRLLFNASMNLDYKMTLEQFTDMFNLSKHIIHTNTEENRQVTYNRDDEGKITVNALTIEKYNWEFFHSYESVYYDGLPDYIIDMIPDWFTEFEKTCLV